jgi:uncharacterized repeat protein (TIGR03803 family)
MTRVGKHSVSGYIALLAISSTLLFSTSRSWAQVKGKVLHTFSGSDGQYPYAGLIVDSHGNLYGTAEYGGANGRGVVFMISPDRGGSGSWTEKVLHSFENGTDGAHPFGGVVFDGHGNLYGTTYSGGAQDYGTVYELSPPGADNGSWTEKVLYSFRGANDGAYPFAGVIIGPQGKLYGTANGGGAIGYGTVFELSAPSGSEPWAETVIYTFCTAANCSDGGHPNASLILDDRGNLYGTTLEGGAYNCGLAFQLSPPANGNGPWTGTMLHNFTGGADGRFPEAGLALDPRGNLYGVSDNGVVFELSPPGNGNGAWTETVLHTFSEKDDGRLPWSALIFDSSGDLYGTTYSGGPQGFGLIFELSPPVGGSAAWNETVLYTLTGEKDGANPEASLVADSQGNLYGTTSFGGAHFDGVVFEISRDSTRANNGNN